MVTNWRFSTLLMLASILLLGCINLAFALILPDASATVWLGQNWKSVGAAFIGASLVHRFFCHALLRRNVPAKVPADVSRESASFWPDGVPELSSLEWGSGEWSRAKALHEAANLPFADAVYRIATYNDWCATPYRIELGELSWLTSAELFEEWLRRVYNLRTSAYHVGDAGLRKDGTYEAAREKFISENPGFSGDTYEQAISYGYQMAR